MKLVNAGLSMISVDQKLVRMILDTSPSNINPIVILVVTKMIQEKMVAALEKPEKKSIHVTNGKINGVEVSVVRSHIGGPHTAMVIECLKRCGVKTIIRFDFCGTLSEDIPVGSIIVPKSALLIDGTSKEYLEEYSQDLQNNNKINETDGIRECICSESLLTRIHNIAQSEKSNIIKIGHKIVTTDALFLETERKIKMWRSYGAQAVDMESSVVYLLSAMFGIEPIAIMVVTDHPGSEKYDMFKNNTIFEGLETSIAKGIELVKKIVFSIAKNR